MNENISKRDIFIVVFFIWISSLFTNNIATIVTALVFIMLVIVKPKNLVAVLLIYYISRPLLVELNDGLKYAGDIGIIILLIRIMFIQIKSGNFKSVFCLEWYEWAYLSFISVGIISALINDVQLISVIFQLRKFLIMYIFYYSVKRINWSKSELFGIFKIVLVMSSIVAAHGIIEKLTQRKILLPASWKGLNLSVVNADRIYGILGNPNTLAVFMLISITIALIVFYQSNNKIYIIMAVFYAGILFLTQSRGTLIAGAVGLFVFKVLEKNRDHLIPIAITLVLGFTIVYLPVNFMDNYIEKSDILIDIGDYFDRITGSSNDLDEVDKRKNDKNDDYDDSISNRFNSIVDRDTISLSAQTGRLFFVKKGFEIFKDNTLIGTGFGTFGDSATLSYPSPIYEKYEIVHNHNGQVMTFYSDNQYIQIIVQTGIIGVISFAVFLLGILKFFFNIRVYNKKVSNLMIGMWFFVAISGIVYNIWENQVFSMFFFVVLGWLFSLSKSKSL